jgi:hypothetical protein
MRFTPSSLGKQWPLGLQYPHIIMGVTLFCAQMLPIITQYADVLVKNLKMKAEKDNTVTMKE